MRRTGPFIAIGLAAAFLAWHLAGAGPCEVDPMLGGIDASGEFGSAVTVEEEGGGGGRALGEETAVPAEGTRLAACGLRSSLSRADGDRIPFPHGDVFLPPTNGGDNGSPPELLEPPDVTVEGEPVSTVERRLTPWWPRAEGDPYVVPVRRRDPVAVGVTERAYAVGAALARLADDPPEVGRVRSWTSVSDEGDAGALADQVYARTGEPLWRTPGAWIGWASGGSGRSEAPLLVRQTAEGHAAVESALDALLTVGGDARTIRVWRGELGPGSLEIGETRRVDAAIPWRAATEGPGRASPLELDVPADRIVTAFLGDAHAFVGDYDVETGQATNVAGPIYDLAHDGLSVRAHVLQDPEEVELQLIDVHQAPPFDTFSTSLASGPVSASAPVVIEVPVRPSKRAVVRLPAREGEAWLVGLGGTRAVLVEIAGRVEGAGRLRPGWDRAPSPGRSGVAADPEPDRAPPREAASPPDGVLLAELVRPARTEGGPPPRDVVGISSITQVAPTPFGMPDRTREEAFPFGGAAGDADRDLELRGGAFLRARWVGGTPGAEAYDVVLAVSEPLGIRDGPPIYGKDLKTPVRLPSFRRAVVPMRIVVPHGGVGRRTVTLDLGNGPEPWTVTLWGGERAE